jgi:hypothetical protein
LNIGNDIKIDRLFSSVGIKPRYDQILPFFSKGTQLPASFEGTFHTGYDNQTRLVFLFVKEK